MLPFHGELKFLIIGYQFNGQNTGFAVTHNHFHVCGLQTVKSGDVHYWQGDHINHCQRSLTFTGPFYTRCQNDSSVVADVYSAADGSTAV